LIDEKCAAKALRGQLPVAGLDFLDPKAAAALSGTLNLHDYETRIDALADTYEQLRRASIH
jgi:hypothetical protein